jgi:hypothetical protein
MSARGNIDPSLRESVELGEYAVDSREVAEAVMRSGMLVAAEPADGPVGTEHDEAASG